MTNYSGDVIEVTGNRKSENFGYDFFLFRNFCLVKQIPISDRGHFFKSEIW